MNPDASPFYKQLLHIIIDLEYYESFGGVGEAAAATPNYTISISNYEDTGERLWLMKNRYIFYYLIRVLYSRD
ncbi:hypothetical protein J2TS4_24810 [Paenibacillus sp. J2TS4]|nr:hypothetical protein J2TS4_24810 [Paenibacillus sp. J2TS4]